MINSAFSFEAQISEMIERAVSANERARLACVLAKRLEERGDYEGARRSLSAWWMRVGERPDLDELDNQTSALLLLRVGALTGWLGSSHQLANAQEIAKDYISESAHAFELLGLFLEYIESQYELMWCYWRAGAFDEARIVAKSALQRLDAAKLALPQADELRAKLLIRAAIVEQRSNRLDEALKLLEDASALIEASGDDLLKGKYHVERGTTLKNLYTGDGVSNQAGSNAARESYLDLALAEYHKAINHFELAGHERYAARVRNNIGMLYLAARSYREARTYLDSALQVFLRLKDTGGAAQVRETMARVYLAEGSYEAAKESAGVAVRALVGGDENALLAEALITYGTALARLKRIDEARSAYLRAADVAEFAGNAEGAARALFAIFEEIGERLSAEAACAVYLRADALLRRTTNIELLRRLQQCAATILTAVSKNENALHDAASTNTEFKETNMNEAVSEMLSFERGSDVLADLLKLPFDEAISRFESRIIDQALKANGQKISKAAQYLGISHQRLSLILKTRHRELLSGIKPRKRRRQHIIGVELKRNKRQRAKRQSKAVKGDAQDA
jgi:tetratricopeptide (TPR) repeat protein